LIDVVNKDKVTMLGKYFLSSFGSAPMERVDTKPKEKGVFDAMSALSGNDDS
jgi:hypothetical protein